MSRASKLLDNIAARRRQAADDLFAPRPVMARDGQSNGKGGRILYARPIEDVATQITIDGQPAVLVIHGSQGDELVADSAMVEAILEIDAKAFETAMSRPTRRDDMMPPIKLTRKAPQGRSLYAYVKRRSFRKRKRYDVWDNK